MGTRVSAGGIRPVSGAHAPVAPRVAANRSAGSSAAAATNAKAPANAGDAFVGGAGLPPFASHYRQSKEVPRLPKGKPTLDTFDEAQVQALHRAYWGAPATAALANMAALAFRDPAFRGRKIDDATERQVGRLMEKLPESFPWGWRSRALAATSHVLVDALVKAPIGTSVTSVLEGLQKKDPAFPGLSAFSRASREAWVQEPARFPFVAASLVNEGGKGGFRIEARGAAAGIRRDTHGRFAMTEELAKQVGKLAQSPAIDYGWTREDFCAFVDDELGGKGAFTKSTFLTLRTSYPKLVPDYLEVRAASRLRVAEAIHDLYVNSGVTTAQGMVVALHEKIGTPLWKTSMLTYLRLQHPELVPDFKAAKAEGAYADARALLDAVLAAPEQSRLEVGRALGHDKQRVNELWRLAGNRWPNEVEKRTRTPFSAEDVRMLQQAIADAPLNATMRDLLDIVATEHPQLLERHPWASPESFYQCAVAPHGGFQGTWHQEQERRYLERFADVVKRSPQGTTLREVVNLLLDEHEGAYGISQVNRMLAAARGAHPPAHLALLVGLKDKKGSFPWESARLELTQALAKTVGAAIKHHQGMALIDIVRTLRRDPAFAKEHPAFTNETVHHLRARFPELVPYVDDVALGPDERRIDAQRRALADVAKKVAAKAATFDEARGLTISGLARATGVEPHRVLAAIRQCPELFPWYKERPAGTTDLYLATRVAHAMELAPLGTTLEQIVDDLRADKKLRARYPAFNYHTVTRLRERYPEVVPAIHVKNQILRSKHIVDAVRAADKGTPWAKIYDALTKAHPGGFPEVMADEAYVKALWSSDPKRFPFASALTTRAGGFSLTGRGEKVAADAASDAALATKLAKLETVPDRLPVIDKLVAGIKGKPFEDTEILAIQHLLGAQVTMFDAARKLGMAPGRSTIVAIPYSVSETVVETLEDKGFDVRVPPLDLEAWYQMVKEAMEERIASALEHGRKIVVFDDGGLVTMMLERYPHLAEHAHLFRIVEQTRRGITVADGVALHTPVVNVAQSWAKYVEGPMVGGRVQKKLMERLARLGIDGIKGKHIGVNGYGSIGAPTARFLREHGAIVTVLDLDEDARKRAKADGYDVVDGNDPKARAKYFGKQDILVGSTGRCSITAEDLAHLKDGAVLGSSSSKLVEIDVEELAKLAKKGRIEVVDAESFPPTVRYHFKDGRTIDLLASGFPMNFDGGVEDVASERIQLTMGLMLAGALQAAGVSAAGLHRLDPSIQLDMIGTFHDDVGERLGGSAVAEAMSLARTHLVELERRHGAREHDLRHRR